MSLNLLVFILNKKNKASEKTATPLKSLFGQNSRLCENVKVENPASTS